MLYFGQIAKISMPQKQIDYKKIIDFILLSGKRLSTRAGNIKDIGITKTDLTEEDLAIERGLKEIISSFGNDHSLYAEEENTSFQNSKHVWVIDPISGTINFIQGLPHYSIVVSHLADRKVVFAAVFDPAVNELFTAYAGKGAFLNDKPIRVSMGSSKIILRPSMAWNDPEVIKRAAEALKNFNIENNRFSMAVNYCAVAAGRADGVAAFTKDSFPEFAGSLIVREAGGIFTNIEGKSNIQPNDRIFLSGNPSCYQKSYTLVKEAVLSK